MSEESLVVEPVPILCSFCGKSRREVRFLIAAPDNITYICEECVLECVESIFSADDKNKEVS